MRQTNEWICLFKDKVTCPISFNSAQIISANTAWVHHMLCSRNCVFSNLTWSVLRIPNLAISRVLLAEIRAPFTLEFSVSTGQSLRQPLPHALSSLTIQSSPPSRRLSPVSLLLICKADTILHSFSKAMPMKGQSLMTNHFYGNAKEIPRGLQPKEGPLKAGFLCACSVAQSYLTLWPYGLCPADSSAHGISQAGILQWVAVSFFRESSPPWGWTRASCIGRQILYHWAPWKPWSWISHSISDTPHRVNWPSPVWCPLKCFFLAPATCMGLEPISCSYQGLLLSHGPGSY